MAIRERIAEMVGGQPMRRAQERTQQFVSKLWQPKSYAVENDRGQTYFVQARSVKVDRHGNLLFKQGLRLVAVSAAGSWTRFTEGLTLEDMQKATEEK